jgi:hypothetical protein
VWGVGVAPQRPRPKAPRPTSIRLTPPLKKPKYMAAAVVAGVGVGAGAVVGGAAATLAVAWREEDAMLGPQLEALQETFGEGLVPFVPTAHLASIFC